MATKVKTVQFRDKQHVLDAYTQTEIPAWALGHGTPGQKDFHVIMAYEGDSVDEGQAILANWLDRLSVSETSGIYTFCLYKKDTDDIDFSEIPRYTWGLQFYNRIAGPATGPEVGMMNQVLQKLEQMDREIKALKEEQEAPRENQLGAIGELLQSEAVQPLLQAFAMKAADWLMQTPKQQEVGALKRVSGIPMVQEPTWLKDQMLLDAVDKLYAKTPELGVLLQKLATVSEKNPKKYGFYINLFKGLK